ncbi:MAG: rod shape-determining protein MreC [Patescibacteria group bacterium]|nr:rod shape-determining protein MreC [Patescibacteria group bacterium]
MAFKLIKNTDRKIAVTAIGAVMLLFFHWFGWLNPLESAVRSFLKPVLGSVYQTNDKVKSGYKAVANKKDLNSELNKLQEENKKLLTENASLQYLREENKVLRKYVNLFDEAKYKYIIGRVVTRQSVEYSDVENNHLIIDKGSKDGLENGLLVVDESGLAVGKITKVKDNLAEVSAVTSRDCRLSVALNSGQKNIGVASGEAGLTIKIDFIPQTEVVNKDDIIITSGLEENIPHGFVIGRISEINKESSEIWQTATIEPSSNLDNIKIVSVLLPGDKFLPTK